jgi:hypothetical protein
MKYLQVESLYVISLEEILWGGTLVAITMAIHGSGMLLVLRVSHAVKYWFEAKKGLLAGLLPIIMASCIIVLVHLTEVLAWAAFLFEGCICKPQHRFLLLAE